MNVQLECLTFLDARFQLKIHNKFKRLRSQWLTQVSCLIYMNIHICEHSYMWTVIYVNSYICEHSYMSTVIYVKSYMWSHICEQSYMWTFIYVNSHICEQLYMWSHICEHSYMSTVIYVNIHICEHSYMWTFIYVNSHICEHSYMWTVIYVNCVDKKNLLDVTFCILYFSSNSFSTCFGQPCTHHQELTTAWCYSLVLVCAVAAGSLSRPVGR